MATGLNLGSFASGFAQGFGDSQKLRLAGEAAQREQERLGFEKQRLEFEAQNQARQAESHQQAMQLQKLQLEDETRKAESRKELQAKLLKKQEELDSPFEGTVYDPVSKKEIGTIRFSDLEQKSKELAAQGKTFVPGSVKEVGPVTDQLMRRKAQMETMVEHKRSRGEYDPDQEAVLVDLNRQYDANKIEKVMLDHNSHNDSKKTLASLKKLGVDFGPDAVVYTEVDPDTGAALPTIGVRGKDGKVQRQIGIDELWLMKRAPDEARKEAREDKRGLRKLRKEGEIQMGIEGVRQRGAMDRSVYEQGAINAREASKVAADAVKNRPEEVRKLTLDYMGKFVSNPNAQYNANAVFKYGSALADGVDKLMAKGMPGPQALNETVKYLQNKGFEPVPEK